MRHGTGLTGLTRLSRGAGMADEPSETELEARAKSEPHIALPKWTRVAWHLSRARRGRRRLGSIDHGSPRDGHDCGSGANVPLQDERVASLRAVGRAGRHS